MSAPTIRFINSFHTISLGVLVTASLSYFIMYKNEYTAPEINLWWLGLSLFALGSLTHSLYSINACGELKELTDSEANRLNHSITLRSRMIRNSILFYFIFVALLSALIWSDLNRNLSLSLLVGLFVNLLLTIWGAINDYIESSEFKREIQKRANQNTEKERIRKKISEASK